MKKITLNLLIIMTACLLASCTKNEMGTVGGAAVGGVVGNAVTGGSALGTVAGAVGGGLIGNAATR